MLPPSRRTDTHAWTGEDRRLYLETMFLEHAPRILDYARFRGATLLEAEDLVSEVFLVLTRRLDDTPDEILPWLYEVARRVFGSHLRGKRRRLALKQRMEELAVPPDTESADPSSVSARDLTMRQALSMLPEKDRELLLLVAWDGLSYEESAQSLGCTPAAFSQALYRARQRLSATIEDIQAYEGTDKALGEVQEQ